MIIKERCSSFGFETINILATVSNSYMGGFDHHDCMVGKYECYWC
jgi:hypothetical protein